MQHSWITSPILPLSTGAISHNFTLPLTGPSFRLITLHVRQVQYGFEPAIKLSEARLLLPLLLSRKQKGLENTDDPRLKYLGPD